MEGQPVICDLEQGAPFWNSISHHKRKNTCQPDLSHRSKKPFCNQSPPPSFDEDKLFFENEDAQEADSIKEIEIEDDEITKKIKSFLLEASDLETPHSPNLPQLYPLDCNNTETFFENGQNYYSDLENFSDPFVDFSCDPNQGKGEDLSISFSSSLKKKKGSTPKERKKHAKKSTCEKKDPQRDNEFQFPTFSDQVKQFYQNHYFNKLPTLPDIATFFQSFPTMTPVYVIPPQSHQSSSNLHFNSFTQFHHPTTTTTTTPPPPPPPTPSTPSTPSTTSLIPLSSPPSCILFPQSPNDLNSKNSVERQQISLQTQQEEKNSSHKESYPKSPKIDEHLTSQISNNSILKPDQIISTAKKEENIKITENSDNLLKIQSILTNLRPSSTHSFLFLFLVYLAFEEQDQESSSMDAVEVPTQANVQIITEKGVSEVFTLLKSKNTFDFERIVKEKLKTFSNFLLNGNQKKLSSILFEPTENIQKLFQNLNSKNLNLLSDLIQELVSKMMDGIVDDVVSETFFDQAIPNSIVFEGQEPVKSN